MKYFDFVKEGYFLVLIAMVIVAINNNPMAIEAPTFQMGIKRAHKARVSEIGDRERIFLIYFLSVATEDRIVEYWLLVKTSDDF